MTNKPEFELPKTPGAPRILRIPRDRWVRGAAQGTTFLSGDGCRCILGFILGAFGVEDEALLGVGDLGDIIDEGCIEDAIYDEVEAPLHMANSGSVTLADVSRGRAMIALNDAPDPALPQMLAKVMDRHSNNLESAGGVDEDLIACADDPEALREKWLQFEAKHLGVELIFE